jgi:putative ABC transport system permease protein
MIRHALRVLSKSPGFSALVLLILAIGIGATTTIFSVVDGVLLKPLPYGDPSRLITIASVFQGNEFENEAYPDIVDWRAQAKSIDAIAGVAQPALTMTGAGEAVSLQVALTTSDLFRMFDVVPALGRTLGPADDVAGAEAVAVISEQAWVKRFGRRSTIVGEAVTLDGRRTTIVGVMPASFQFPIAAEPFDAWVPIDGWDLARKVRDERGIGFLQVFGRLAPNATLQEVNAELETIGRRVADANPDTNRNRFPRASLLQHRLVREYRLALMLLLAAVGVVLLVACGNVANLLLSRGMARQRELAIRAAVGASRARLLRQLLAESLVLSTAATLVGVLFAVWGVGAIASVADVLQIPRLREVSVDWRVLLFTTAVSVATGMLFGLAPALQLSLVNASDAMRQAAHGMKARRSERTRQALVVLEVALSLVLLASGGLLVRSLAALQRVDPGFVAERALAAGVALPESRYPDGAALLRFYERLRHELAEIPGATAVGLSSMLPLAGTDASWDIHIEGQIDAPGERRWATYFAVSPDYFRAMGIRLIEGRTFTARDTSAVLIISETMARRYWPGERAVGKRVSLGLGGGPREVVGVVADVKNGGLWDEREASMYTPFSQNPLPSLVVVIRTSGDPSRLSGPLRDAIRRIDADQAVDVIKTLTEIRDTGLAAPRMATTVFAAFAAFTVLLAGCGLFSVMAYSVAQRRREIGIRMALGARFTNVRSLVVVQAIKLGAVGLAFGLAGAFAAGRLLEGRLLFGGITSTDPVTLAAVCLTLFTVLVLAAYLPARRATSVNPAAVLRAE